MHKLFNSLNQEQQKAVLYNDGPLAIIAGAGSGKTRTLTHKIAYLIEVENVEPRSILAVTFTNKAADEMKERVIDLIGDRGHDVFISTYHSLCARILRSDIDHLGYKRNFNIIDNVDQKQILRPGYKKLGLSSRTITFARTISMISRFKNGKMSISEVRASAVKDIDVAYANLYEFYLNQTRNSNNLDFDDLLIITEQLLKSKKAVVQKWASRFSYVLIDEFQDTSTTQNEIIKFISQEAICTVVGDPDQNIYTWRYADPQLITDFSTKNSESETILLEQNYRSTQKILAAANRLIKNNRDRIEKNLFTTNPNGADIEYHHGFSEDSEAAWVVNKIRALLKHGEKENSIAVLYRSNFLANPLEKALIQANINYIVYGSIKFYQREEIKDVLSYLKLVNNGDPIALKRMINVPARSIGPKAQDKIFSVLSRYGPNAFQVLIDHFPEIQIPLRTKNQLAHFINVIRKHQRLLKSNRIKNVIESFLAEVNYESKWSAYEEPGRIDNIKQLISNIENWETENRNRTLTDFINETALYTDYENKTIKNKKTVSLMTIHSSKGLEFKHVFIFGMMEDVFPSQKTKDEMAFDAMEEERRLAYVAVTRAKENLYISSSRGFSREYSKQKTPSRFIKELGINPKAHSKDFVFEKSYLSNKPKVANNFIEGETIMHSKFGKGTVLTIEDEIIRVSFRSPHGVKSIMKNHQSIKKEEI